MNLRWADLNLNCCCCCCCCCMDSSVNHRQGSSPSLPQTVWLEPDNQRQGCCQPLIHSASVKSQNLKTSVYPPWHVEHGAAVEGKADRMKVPDGVSSEGLKKGFLIKGISWRIYRVCCPFYCQIENGTLSDTHLEKWLVSLVSVFLHTNMRCDQKVQTQSMPVHHSSGHLQVP